jgi:PAS domain S-box-containing protein
MIISDKNGNIKVANAQSEKLFHYSKEELLNKTIAGLVPESFHSRQKEIIMDFFTQRMPQTSTIEFVCKKKNGSEFPAEISLAPIKSNEGIVICASIRDISERIRFQNELNQKYEELKKTNTELDRFVYSTSHDLRSPLTSLLGLISIVNDNLPEHDEEQKLRVEMMKRSVKKLDSFIGDILDYSRNNRMELEIEEISFENMLRETCDRHKYMLGSTSSEMKISVMQHDKFYSDSRRLNLIFNNLISNALKYQDKSKKHSFVSVSVATTPKNASISIEDNGIGIDTKDHQKIFEMFYRATKTSTGSGLGLYIVKEAVDKLNGKIRIESEQGKGSKFIVDIPNLFDKF